jgi:hypothetical protein
LSPEYERKLSIRAQAYVDKCASEILIDRSLGSREPFKKENTLDDPADLEGMTLSSRRPGGNESETDVGSSSCFEVDDEVFEDQSSSQSKTRMSRHYSSSPATSCSNDANDGTSVMDIDSHDESTALRAIANKQYVPRQLRRSGKSRLYESQALQPPHIINMELALDLKKDSNLHEGTPNIRLLREVQSLRIAGADKNTPRPYIRFWDRENIRLGCRLSDKYPGRLLSRAEQNLLQQSVLHVDFCLEELEFICKVIQSIRKVTFPLNSDLGSQVISLMNGQELLIADIIDVLQKVLKMPGKQLGRHLLRNRGVAAINGFLLDAAAGKINHVPQLVQFQTTRRCRKILSKPSVSALLQQREIGGMAPVRVCRGQQSFNVEIASHLEDTLIRKSEWTDCCGDISAVSWTGNATFVCGATAHSDYHNMQYNKPGNLVVGSSSLDTLRAVADHRVIRPIIGTAENVENALESMRLTQDPWLYTSVVSTSHSEMSGFTFTASFDETVKVWKVSEDGSSMDLCGTWDHSGKVNFVVTSDHHKRVATASDVSNDAIRVYNFNEDDITDTPYDTYSGDKPREQAQDLRTDTWAYFPATIQWGKSPDVWNFLLVGYSPRSITAHESEIPEDKKNSGELCLWNVVDGSRIPISSARTQNVFEVIWHPTQPIFLAATSPCGTFEPEIRTQIRLFAQNEFGPFLQIKTLDCLAFDINELTIM